LLSLDNAGVREIKLAYTNAGTNPDQLDNEHRQTSTYTTTSGKLVNPRRAMMRDTSAQLFTAVNAYLNYSNLAQRDSLLQDVFYRWAGMQDHDPTRRRPKRSEQIFEPEFLRENVMWGPAE